MNEPFIIQKRTRNSDFQLSRIKKARILEIGVNKEGNILQFRPKDCEKPTYEIPLNNILEAEIIYQKNINKTDLLMQIIFLESNQRLRIARINIQDDQIRKLRDKVRELCVRIDTLRSEQDELHV